MARKLIVPGKKSAQEKNLMRGLGVLIHSSPNLKRLMLLVIYEELF